MFVASSINAQEPCLRIATLINSLEKNHYRPKYLTYAKSQVLQKEFIESLDPYCLYFTEIEFADLLKDSVYFFPPKNNSYCEFLHHTNSVYQNALSRADSIILLLKGEAWNTLSTDSIAYRKNQGMTFSENEEALKNRWKRWLTFSLYIHICENDSIGNEALLLPEEELLARVNKYKEKILERERCRLKQILETPEGFENYVFSMYMNTITETYDPHSAYMLPQRKDYYETGLSSEAFSFGFDVSKNDDGEIIISSISPGGPAWKSNKINKGDKLLSIKWSKKDSLDLSCISLYDVKETINSTPSSEMQIRIQKRNGNHESVLLYKEKMRVEENVVNSFVLKGTLNIGYISLPGFYTEMDGEKALGCANDVAKEIIKLKRENIGGLILDLRNNGGGSLAEAMDLTGIFIDEGPLTVYQYRDGTPSIYKDMNRGKIWDGPLLVMINSMSASASEIVSASLQDYNRAVIVGSNSYGKASGQIIIPLNEKTNFSKNIIDDTDDEAGYVKLTMSRYYRLDGKTHQGIGIKPDIFLPDDSKFLNYSESNYASALPTDSIFKEINYTPFSPLPLDEMRKKSADRISIDTCFLEIVEVIDSITHYFKNIPKVPLHTESFSQRMTIRDELYDAKYALGKRKSSIFIVDNCRFDKSLLAMDKQKQKMNASAIESIEEDIYIDESYKILLDLIDLNAND